MHSHISPPPKSRTQREAMLQRECLDYLGYQYPKWLAHHSPNEGARHYLVGQANTRKGTKRGYPDLAIHAEGGRTCLVEMKAATGKLSESQSMLIDRLRALGHTLFVVNSFDLFRALIDAWARGEDVKQELI